MRKLFALTSIGVVVGISILATCFGSGQTAIVASNGDVCGSSHKSPIANQSEIALRSRSLPKEPDELEGFFEWSSAKQLTAITALQDHGRLSDEVVKFASQAIKCNNLHATTRNNIANLLLNQEKKISDLDLIFISIIDDPSEKYDCRENSVQHLALSIDSSGSPMRVIEKLADIAKSGVGGMAGTAMIQLDRLESTRAINLNLNELIRAAARKEDDVLIRATAIELIGRRNMLDELDYLRSLVIAEKDSSIIRIALAAIGLLGDTNDEKLLDGYTYNDNRLVAWAARGALKRIRERARIDYPGRVPYKNDDTGQCRR